MSLWLEFQVSTCPSAHQHEASLPLCRCKEFAHSPAQDRDQIQTLPINYQKMLSVAVLPLAVSTGMLHTDVLPQEM